MPTSVRRRTDQFTLTRPDALRRMAALVIEERQDCRTKTDMYELPFTQRQPHTTTIYDMTSNMHQRASKTNYATLHIDAVLSMDSRQSCAAACGPYSSHAALVSAYIQTHRGPWPEQPQQTIYNTSHTSHHHHHHPPSSAHKHTRGSFFTCAVARSCCM